MSPSNATRNLIAYFRTEDDARSIEPKLRAMRAAEIEIDRLAGWPESASGIVNPISGNFSSLANLTMNAVNTNADYGTLLSADPDASGMSGGDDLKHYNYIMTAVVNSDAYERVLRLVREAGGIV